MTLRCEANIHIHAICRADMRSCPPGLRSAPRRLPPIGLRWPGGALGFGAPPPPPRRASTAVSAQADCVSVPFLWCGIQSRTTRSLWAHRTRGGRMRVRRASPPRGIVLWGAGHSDWLWMRLGAVADGAVPDVHSPLRVPARAAQRRAGKPTGSLLMPGVGCGRRWEGRPGGIWRAGGRRRFETAIDRCPPPPPELAAVSFSDRRGCLAERWKCGNLSPPPPGRVAMGTSVYRGPARKVRSMGLWLSRSSHGKPPQCHSCPLPHWAGVTLWLNAAKQLPECRSSEWRQVRKRTQGRLPRAVWPPASRGGLSRTRLFLITPQRAHASGKVGAIPLCRCWCAGVARGHNGPGAWSSGGQSGPQRSCWGVCDCVSVCVCVCVCVCVVLCSFLLPLRSKYRGPTLSLLFPSDITCILPSLEPGRPAPSIQAPRPAPSPILLLNASIVRCRQGLLPIFQGVPQVGPFLPGQRGPLGPPPPFLFFLRTVAPDLPLCTLVTCRVPSLHRQPPLATHQLPSMGS